MTDRHKDENRVKLAEANLENLWKPIDQMLHADELLSINKLQFNQIVERVNDPGVGVGANLFGRFPMSTREEIDDLLAKFHTTGAHCA